MAIDQPGCVAGLSEREQRLSQLPEGPEGPYPQQIFLQRADEALGTAIAFRGADECPRAVDAAEGQFFWK